MHSSFLYDVDLENFLGSKIKLDENQQRIVLSEASSIMVYAGAGTGKTTTILARIKFLVEKRGVPASSILLISYTRETVKELKHRLHDQYHLFVQIQTFHQFALSLLKKKVEFQILANPAALLTKCIEMEIGDRKTCRNLVLAYPHLIRGPSFLLPYFSYSLYKKVFFRASSVSIFLALTHFFMGMIAQIKCTDRFLDRIHITSALDKKKIAVLQSIYEKYQLEMRKKKYFDFEDIILEGIEILRQENLCITYTHVIVDEYQDISDNRFRLLYDYVTKAKANIMVVGDDFQSIYGFSGSDVALFTHFTTYWPKTESYYITKTYRNSHELIEIAGAFVMKNKQQVVKQLSSNKRIEKPVVMCYRNKKMQGLQRVLSYIVNEYGSSETILLLGRYQFDIHFIEGDPRFVVGSTIVSKLYPNLSIRFLTVHAAKGLEADHVILLNTEDGIYGFPSNVPDIIGKEGEETYLYAEERRLFYVALTRTRNRVYLLVLKNGISSFVKELVHDYREAVLYL